MKIRGMTQCAMMAALMAVCAWISVPMGDIAVSLQTFAVFLTLGLLGGQLGTVSCLVYVLLGAIGLPVFTGFRGGLSALLGPTGGYLWGFLAAGLIYWLLENRLPKWLLMAIGMVACYICGTLWYFLVYAQTGLWVLILQCVVPFLIPDAVKLTLALNLSHKFQHITIPPEA